MSKIPLFFIIVVALIVVLASLRFVQQRRVEAENDAQPLTSRSVTVEEKREFSANDRRSRQRDVTPAGELMRYEVSFRPVDGGVAMRFRVNSEQYQTLTTGTAGTLHYRGTRYEGFTARP